MAAAQNPDKNLYAIQFHPEVLHTVEGTKMLSNFVYQVCGCTGDWKMDSFVQQSIRSWLIATVGTARQNNTLWIHLPYFFQIRLIRINLTVDIALSDATRHLCRAGMEEEGNRESAVVGIGKLFERQRNRDNAVNFGWV